jgi:hypothetical protein
MDFYNNENAEIALSEVLAAKEEYLKEIQMLDSMAFILRYYIETGDMMDPGVFGIEPVEDSEDEDE